MSPAEEEKMEDAMRERTERESMRKIVDQLFNEINNFSYEKHVKYFFDAITHQHRTLQQSFWRTIVEVAKKYAELDKDGWYDLRNEASVKMCAKLKKWFESDDNYLGLPTI